MLQHLSTRPPTTRPRSPNPQPHSALIGFSSAEFHCFFFLLSSLLPSFLLHQKKKEKKKGPPLLLPPTKRCSVIFSRWHATPVRWKRRSCSLPFVCGFPKRVRLVTWWHEWAPLLAAAGPCLHTLSGCQIPLYLFPTAPPPPRLPPASSSIPQQWANSDWAPLCVMWEHRNSLCLHFKRPNRQHGIYF